MDFGAPLSTTSTNYSEWNIPSSLRDFDFVEYDIDSVVVCGDRSFSWIKPKIQLTCLLNKCNVEPFQDSKVLGQLRQKTNTSTYPGYKWISFNVGGLGIDAINVIASVDARIKLYDPATKRNSEPLMRNYRKRFFEHYLYPAIRLCEAQVQHQSHTRLGNTLQDLPTSAKLHIYPDTWPNFAENIDKLLADKLPDHTDALFVHLTAHGLKSGLDAADLDKAPATGRAQLYDRLSGIIRPSSSSVKLAQVHLAASLQKQQQVVVADFTKISNCFPRGSCSEYKFFLFDQLGTFAARQIKPLPHSRWQSMPAAVQRAIENITYSQFYLDNAHLLIANKPHLGKCSHFANAAFGDVNPKILAGPQQLCKELTQHRQNLQLRRLQEASFLKSCKCGAAARFELVFSFQEVDHFLTSLRQFFQEAAAATPTCDDAQAAPTLQRAIDAILAWMMDGQIIISSTGSWWLQRHLLWYEATIFKPLTEGSMTQRLDNRPLTLDQLRYVYDLDTLNSAFIGSSWNTWLDTRRLRILKANRYRIALPDRPGPARRDWFDDRLISRYGYSPALKNHIGTVIAQAPVTQAEQLQRAQFPFVALFALYEAYCRKAWHLPAPNRLANQPPTSVFSAACFNRAQRRQRQRLYLSETACTSHSILDSMLDPVTAIGQILLAQNFDENSLRIARQDDNVRTLALRIIKNNANYFPVFLLNPRHATTNQRRDWARWCAVDDRETMGAGYSGATSYVVSNRFHPYRVPEPKPRYDKRLNLKQNRRKPQ